MNLSKVCLLIFVIQGLFTIAFIENSLAAPIGSCEMVFDAGEAIKLNVLDAFMKDFNYTHSYNLNRAAIISAEKNLTDARAPGLAAISRLQAAERITNDFHYRDYHDESASPMDWLFLPFGEAF